MKRIIASGMFLALVLATVQVLAMMVIFMSATIFLSQTKGGQHDGTRAMSDLQEKAILEKQDMRLW